MSNTKGSMLISNANAVGTELVNQLGGTGYKPSEWSDAINLLGISDDDKASALAGITEGTYTGTERGAIKYSNCNAVGAMLNKKFSTNRGFKPVEWESAISKLTPLAEGTVSGAICNIVNGADNVPMKSVIAHIASTLTGTNAVNMVQTGKNLLQNLKYQATANRVNIGQSDDGFSISLRAGTYTLSVSSSINISAYYRGENDGSNTLIWSTYSTSGSGTFTLSEDKDVRMWVIGQDGSVSTSDVLTIQLEVGSTATDYEPYTEPTSYTANLGRTVYGADVDLVSGQGTSDGAVVTLDDTMSYGINLGTDTNRIAVTFYNSVGKINGTFASNVLTVGENTTGGYKSEPWVIWGSTSASRMWISVPTSIDTVDKFKQYLQSNTITIAYELATGTDFTFDGQEIPSLLGINNLWHEAGDSTITYRKDPDIPDPPAQLLNMNNNNEDNNEGV